MKPLNNDDPGCNYTTSNCVIWQGPDIPCIKLCKGDSVSEVVYKLATELCTLMDIVKIEAYDLSCFNLTSCKPDDFQQLIQFLIERICKLEGCTGCIPNCDGTSTPPTPTSGAGGGCPDCIVAIAPCFYYTNELGDVVTAMQLQDYVTAIGNRICGTVQTVGTQQGTLNNHERRIVTLEEAPPATYVPPTLIPSCVLPAIPQEQIDVLAALESQFCQLRGATGMPDAIYQNISKQCAGLNLERTLNGSGSTMASLPGWSSSVTTMAQAFGNMWLTICDMRQAIKTIQLNCCPTGCDGIELNMLAVVAADVLTVYVTGTIPAGFVQCAPGTTQVRVTDGAGASATFTMDLVGFLNNPTGAPISLAGSPLNTGLDLFVEIQPCLTDPSISATCQSYLSYTIVNSSTCPAVSYSSTQTTIGYSFTSQLGNYTYNVQVWDNTGTTMISNQIQAISGVQTVTGTFNGLSAGTNYKVRLVVTPTGCDDCSPTTCPFTAITTNPPTCPAPEAVSAGIEID